MAQTRYNIKQPASGLEFRNFQGFNKLCALFDNGLDGDQYKFDFIKIPFKVGDKIWIQEPAQVVSLDGNSMKMTCQYLSDDKKVTLNVPDRFIGNIDSAPSQWYANAIWTQKKQRIPGGCISELARTFVTVIGIRVERLNSISEDDALKEGLEEVLVDGGIMGRLYGVGLNEVDGIYSDTPINAFKQVFESNSGQGSFNNDWVLVVEFHKN